jgi:RNA polymerase sigma factor (sigma-70 family)
VAPRSRSEGELLELARDGDGDAYVELVRMHQDVAFRTAYLIVGSAAEAEDATQEAFVKAFRALGRFQAGRPFRPWLLRIVANEARNHRRSAGRRGALAARAEHELSRRETGVSPEESLLAAEGRAELLSAVARLSPADRLAIVGRFVLGLSDEEAAAALGVQPVVVRVRVWRALGRLRRELGEEVA